MFSEILPNLSPKIPRTPKKSSEKFSENRIQFRSMTRFSVRFSVKKLTSEWEGTRPPNDKNNERIEISASRAKTLALSNLNNSFKRSHFSQLKKDIAALCYLPVAFFFSLFS